MWPKIEIKYTSDSGYGYYWHLLDEHGTIRCWSGQGFGNDAKACGEDAQAAVVAMRNPNLRIVMG